MQILSEPTVIVALIGAAVTLTIAASNRREKVLLRRLKQARERELRLAKDLLFMQAVEYAHTELNDELNGEPTKKRVRALTRATGLEYSGKSTPSMVRRRIRRLEEELAADEAKEDAGTGHIAKFANL